MTRRFDPVIFIILLTGLGYGVGLYSPVSLKPVLFFFGLSFALFFTGISVNLRDRLQVLVFLLLAWRTAGIFFTKTRPFTADILFLDTGLLLFALLVSVRSITIGFLPRLSFFLAGFAFFCVMMSFVRFGFISGESGFLLSTFGNKNFLGSFVIFVLPLLLCHLLFCIEKGFYLKAGLLSFFGIILLYSLFEIESKGAFFGFGMSLLLFFVFILYSTRGIWLKPRFKRLFILFVILFFTIFFSREEGRKFIRSFGYVGTSAFRIDTYRACLEMARDKLLLGRGRGSFRFEYPPYRPLEVLRFEKKANTETVHAHNEYLEVLVEDGVIGLTLFLLILFETLRRLLREGSGDRERDVLRRGLMFGFIAFMAHNLFSVNFRYIQNGILFWLVVGVAFHYRDFRTREKPSLLPARVMMPILAIIIFGAVYLPNLLLARAVSNSESARYLEANPLYQTTISLNKSFPESRYFYGQNLLDQKDPESALKVLETLKRDAPFFVALPYRISQCYAELGNRDMELVYLKRFLKLYPLYVPGISQLAMYHYREGNKYQALYLFSRTVELDPFSPGNRNNYANALYFSGREEEALRQYRLNIELNPEYVDGLLNLAEILLRRGEMNRSRELFQKVLLIEPDNDRALARLRELMR